MPILSVDVQPNGFRFVTGGSDNTVKIWNLLPAISARYEMGEKVYLNVPSGNFGNALGGYYAMKMCVPVEKIIIASNENNVLTRLINLGKYDLNGHGVVSTTSPVSITLLTNDQSKAMTYNLKVLATIDSLPSVF